MPRSCFNPKHHPIGGDRNRVSLRSSLDLEVDLEVDLERVAFL